MEIVFLKEFTEQHIFGMRGARTNLNGNDIQTDSLAKLTYIQVSSCAYL